jgi:hypothetical protein
MSKDLSEVKHRQVFFSGGGEGVARRFRLHPATFERCGKYAGFLEMLYL